MADPVNESRIYLLDADERRTITDGPAVIGPDGRRHSIPPLVCEAVMHVVEAMRAGMAVKVVPLRPELPIDQAAWAIGMHSDELRKYVADDAIPFRSTEYVDWVRLDQLIAWDNEQRRARRAVLDEMLAEDPWDESDE